MPRSPGLKSPPPQAKPWDTFVTTVFPSRRPEKGGTRRDKGYWEIIDQQGGDVRRPVAPDHDSQRVRRDSGPDELVRWNTAKRMPGYERRDRLSLAIPGEHNRLEIAPRPRHSRAHRSRASEGVAPGPSNQELFSAQVDRRLSLERRKIESTRHSRRRKRSLMARGDYLGAQGVNPETGELDITASSGSGRSSLDDGALDRINAIRRVLSNAKDSYKDVTEWTNDEMRKIIADNGANKQHRTKRNRVDISKPNNDIHWRRHTKQWASLGDPESAVSPRTDRFAAVNPYSRSAARKAYLTHVPDADQSRMATALLQTKVQEQMKHLRGTVDQLHLQWDANRIKDASRSKRGKHPKQMDSTKQTTKQKNATKDPTQYTPKMKPYAPLNYTTMLKPPRAYTRTTTTTGSGQKRSW